MLGVDLAWLWIVGIVAVVPFLVKDIFDIAAYAPTLLAIAQNNIGFVDCFDLLIDQAFIGPITSKIIFPGSGNRAECLTAAIAYGEIAVQYREGRILRRPGN